MILDVFLEAIFLKSKISLDKFLMILAIISMSMKYSILSGGVLVGEVGFFVEVLGLSSLVLVFPCTLSRSFSTLTTSSKFSFKVVFIALFMNLDMDGGSTML